MKIIKLLLVLAVAFGGFKYYQANAKFEHPLAGEWKSDKIKSMREHRDAGLSLKQEAALREMFGEMTISFAKDTVTSNFRGQIDEAPYKILSEKDDCYEVEVKGEAAELCIRDGDLFMPVDIREGGYEVFVRQ